MDPAEQDILERSFPPEGLVSAQVIQIQVGTADEAPGFMAAPDPAVAQQKDQVIPVRVWTGQICRKSFRSGSVCPE